MTAPDHTLAARLAKVAKVAQGGGLGDGWPLKNELVDAYRSGQLITLSDHTAAVQAAVAKAVEAAKAAIADICPHADVPGGNTVPNTFDEGTSAAFEVVSDLITPDQRTALQAAIDAAVAKARAEDAARVIAQMRQRTPNTTYDDTFDCGWNAGVFASLSQIGAKP